MEVKVQLYSTNNYILKKACVAFSLQHTEQYNAMSLLRYGGGGVGVKDIHQQARRDNYYSCYNYSSTNNGTAMYVEDII
jgi:hypothetical protein